ncbi:cyclin delta-3 family protein [Skeletonema marinoi]|uniref:Cyclin delta-3 family protein n=1 Tax=Skeletonema marinoi TaxID=267567 RepID=A0AAD8Y6B3_9STRA|nr:cyclin delta-3 family protein [Skeletonema marinoi]
MKRLALSASFFDLLRTEGSSRLFGKSSDEETELIGVGVSRLDTLQTLLSRGVHQGGGDIVPIPLSSSSSSEFKDLHPHLLPLARSQAQGTFTLAIVESAVGLPGMRLLSLNSEHLMRRICADTDANLEGDDAQRILELYNDGLGSGSLGAMDVPYEMGSVEKLGYGLEKYVLLRVGPFPDLYETMANQHLSRGDEESSLIAAEASNGKFGGFGSTFAFYAKLLSSLPNRDEECRDAARMCVRMPLPSMGLTVSDFATVSKMAHYADAADNMRQHCRNANYLLDIACLTGQKYGEVREEIANIYRSAGMESDADFADRIQ